MIKFYFKKLNVIIFISLLFLLGCKNIESTIDSHTMILSDDWKMQDNSKLEGKTGEVISKEGFNTGNWHKAVVPGTVMGSLVADGTIADPYFGVNMKSVDSKQFEQTWWYRNEFSISGDNLEKNVTIRFKGINYRADLWINGKLVADKNKFAGTYRMFTFKISDYLTKGKNVVAVELSQPADGEYSIGFVDWNPIAPDRNMGIFRDVILEFTDGVKIRSPFVHAKVDKKTLNKAELTIQAELENNTSESITGILSVDYGLGKVEKEVTVGPNKTISCIFTSEEYQQLKVDSVALWWPNGMGEANLYDLSAEFVVGNKISDKVLDRYGIREVESYLDENRNRAFRVNGKFVMLSGGGWVDDLLLQDSLASVKAQLEYVKHMNMNSIRLEGFWGKDDVLYDLADAYGILIMVGWSCHWEWDEYLLKPVDPKYGGAVSDEDINLIADYWLDQMLWLRNHPSIYVWMLGSDMLPAPKLEEKYMEMFEKYDTSRPVVTSAGGVGSDQGIIGSNIYSEISGETGMKMLGPYAYTPPIYWYMDTTLGGAYGFNTETCPGPNISPLASLKKMLPADKLWPIDEEYWEYHCGRNAFQTLDRYMEAIDMRYGESSNVEDFAFKSQIMNYELMRPMFESFIAHKPKSTGLVQWMLNSAWPEMYWQLYDTYLQPNGAFYAVRNAGTPVHTIYRYGMNDIYIANNTLDDMSNLRVEIKMYDINSKEIFADDWNGDLFGNKSKPIYQLPEIKDLTDVWFLDMRIYDAQGVQIDDNFYWLSLKKDVLDYEADKGDNWYYTPSKEYADFTALNTIEQVNLSCNYNYKKDEDSGIVDVTIKNTSDKIAFFIFLDVVDSKSGLPILPIFWDDNYVSLLPNEERSYRARYNLSDSNTGKPVIKVKAWNSKTQVIY